MRVRPFFAGLFVCVCLGVLVLAALFPHQVPARLQIQQLQRPVLATPTTFLVEATDAQGVVLDSAQITSQAWMTNMDMAASNIATTPEGAGTYLVRIPWSMVGPWIVTISMQAPGFTPLHQTLLVQVGDASTLDDITR